MISYNNDVIFGFYFSLPILNFNRTSYILLGFTPVILEMSSSELLRYFADEARQYNPDAYVVDVYRPIPVLPGAFFLLSLNFWLNLVPTICFCSLR